jgi:hypothetical protein
MKFYGHANLQHNELQNAALTTLTVFPDTPVMGQLAFVNSIVYICVQGGELPVWVPLTREITAYTHSQAEPASTWTITHSLNTTSVNTQVYDNLNSVLIPDDIQTTGPNTQTIRFNTAVAGRAVIVSGSYDGKVRPTYAYTHYQSSANATWVVAHNLGYHPITRVFIGNSEVQPASIVHNSTNQVTITFSTPQVGYARLI